MAITGASAAKSQVYKRQTAINADRDSLSLPLEMSGKERVVRFDHTLVADDGSASLIVTDDEMNLFVLPAGAAIDLKRSYFGCSAAQGDATDLRIGYRAYEKPDGSVAAEDANGVCVFTDLGNSDTVIRQFFGTGESGITLGNGADKLGVVKFNSKGPVTIFAKAADGSGTFDGDVGDVYSFQFAYYVD